MFLIDQRIFVKTWINKNKYDKLQWLVNIHLASGTRFPNFFSNILSLTLSWQFIISLYYTNLPNNPTLTLIIISSEPSESRRNTKSNTKRRIIPLAIVNFAARTWLIRISTSASKKKKKTTTLPHALIFFPSIHIPVPCAARS